MAPRKRRRLAVGAGGSIGTLLADTRQAIQDAERAAQKVENDSKKSAGQRLKQAQGIASSYVKDGSLTYEEAKVQLDKMLSEETDAEAKMYISDYITDLKTTRDTRDVNNLGEDYTYGRISYEDYRSRATAKMSGVTNELIKQAIAKNMDAARVTENQRLVSKWSSDYSSGRMPYDQYVGQLSRLKGDPSQKSPAELDKLQQTMDAAKENEQALEDNKAWAQYQQSPGSAATAMSYFNKRLAESKNPKDAQRIEQYLKAITSSETKRGSGTADGTMKEAKAASAAQAVKFEKDFKVLTEASGDDPLRQKALYSARAEFYSTLTGSDPNYQQEVEMSPVLGDAAAAKAYANAERKQIAALRASVKPPTSEDTPEERQRRINIYSRIAAIASLAETSPWFRDAQGNPAYGAYISEFIDERKASADELRAEAQFSMAATAEATSSAAALRAKAALLGKQGLSQGDDSIKALAEAEKLERLADRSTKSGRAAWIGAQAGAFPSSQGGGLGDDGVQLRGDTGQESPYIPPTMNRNFDLAQPQALESGMSTASAPLTPATIDYGQSVGAEDFRGPQADMGTPSVAAMGPTGWEAPMIDAGAPTFSQMLTQITPPPLADPTIPQFQMPSFEGPIDTGSETKREDARLTR